jgi:hypothetical protein
MTLTRPAMPQEPTPQDELAYLRRNWLLYAITYVADADCPWSAKHITDPDASRHTERTAIDLHTWLKDDAEVRRMNQPVGGWVS